MPKVIVVADAILPTYPKWPVGAGETGTMALNKLLSGARIAGLNVLIWVGTD